MATETYNPRDKSFIKVPEKKVCPTCGHDLAPEVKPLTNEMSEYVNPISGRIMVINSIEPVLEIQGVKVYRVTGKDAKGNPVSTYIPAQSSAPKAPEAPKAPAAK